MKLLPEWAIASKRNYQSNIFTRTWWNIVIFHTFFVVVMVLLFAVILHYTKTHIFATVSEMLQIIIAGGTVDSNLIRETAAQIDQANLFILSGMVVFAAVTGILAAHITLVPTREEFSQRKKFITAVAHELRTPLAVMRTSNEVALYDLNDKQSIQEVIYQNIEETKRIANILNNLVIFSRVGATESLSFDQVSVHELLLAVTHKLKTFAEKRSVNITYDDSPLPQIRANATALEQVFYNIVKNAIIYSKKGGGAVTITAFANASHVVVTITDNGIGISRTHLRRIFEPFFRINPDDSQFAGGTGLGLSLVFEIMKLHNGTITVDSVEKEGTTFTLQFPLSTLSLIQEDVPATETSVTYTFSK